MINHNMVARQAAEKEKKNLKINIFENIDSMV